MIEMLGVCKKDGEDDRETVAAGYAVPAWRTLLRPPNHHGVVSDSILPWQPNAAAEQISEPTVGAREELRLMSASHAAETAGPAVSLENVFGITTFELG